MRTLLNSYKLTIHAYKYNSSSEGFEIREEQLHYSNIYVYIDDNGVRKVYADNKIMRIIATPGPSRYTTKITPAVIEEIENKAAYERRSDKEKFVAQRNLGIAKLLRSLL